VIAGLSEADITKRIWVQLSSPIPEISSDTGVVSLSWRSNKKWFGLAGVNSRVRCFASVEYVVADALYIPHYGWSCLWNDPEKGPKLRKMNSVQGAKNLKAVWKQSGFRKKRIEARIRFFHNNPDFQRNAVIKGLLARVPKWVFILTFPDGTVAEVRSHLSVWARKNIDVLRGLLHPFQRGYLLDYEVVNRFVQGMQGPCRWHGITVVKVPRDKKD